MPLRDEAESFADTLSDTLRRVLLGDMSVGAVEAPDGARYIVQPLTGAGLLRRLPLYVAGRELADLTVQLYLEMDTLGKFLKAVKSKLAIHSILDSKQPLVRLEYISGLVNQPVAHWHFHAERGSLTRLLTLAHENQPREFESPHTLSSLHFPVGGERFRPCTEDFLEFLVRECGVDAEPGWQTALAEGRQRWRRMQLRTAVRDLQAEAAQVLEAHGWTVTPPKGRALTESLNTLVKW